MPALNAAKRLKSIRRKAQAVPPEPMWPLRIKMPPSLTDALRVKARELGYSIHSLARIYLMQGLAGAGAPPPEWWFRTEPENPTLDDKIEVVLQVPIPQFVKIREYQHREGWQTRQLAILQLVTEGLSAANNRGTGIGGRY